MFRAWFFQCLATSNGVRDWSAFDHTLAVAAAHGVKIIATLGTSGRAARPAATSGTAGTRAATSPPDPGTITTYRQWVSDVVAPLQEQPHDRLLAAHQRGRAQDRQLDDLRPVGGPLQLRGRRVRLWSTRSIPTTWSPSARWVAASAACRAPTTRRSIRSRRSTSASSTTTATRRRRCRPTSQRSQRLQGRLDKPHLHRRGGIQAQTVGGTSRPGRTRSTSGPPSSAAGISGFLVWSWNNSRMAQPTRSGQAIR